MSAPLQVPIWLLARVGRPSRADCAENPLTIAPLGISRGWVVRKHRSRPPTHGPPGHSSGPPARPITVRRATRPGHPPAQ
jgi:hypothetical protein